MEYKLNFIGYDSEEFYNKEVVGSDVTELVHQLQAETGIDIFAGIESVQHKEKKLVMILKESRCKVFAKRIEIEVRKCDSEDFSVDESLEVINSILQY